MTQADTWSSNPVARATFGVRGCDADEWTRCDGRVGGLFLDGLLPEASGTLGWSRHACAWPRTRWERHEPRSLFRGLRGLGADELIALVESGLVAKGCKQACNQFDGRVRGYTNGSEKLLTKVDSLGPVLALAVGNERGSDKLLYGVCFDGYRLEKPERVK